MLGEVMYCCWALPVLVILPCSLKIEIAVDLLLPTFA